MIHKFGRFLGGAAAALVCIMFIFSATVSALPLDIGFSTTKLSAEERNRFLGSINFESTNKEPDWESISCFDVSDSGYIAIVGESKNGHNSISVYDKDGKFAYGYTLDCSGRFGVGWNGDNIAVYFVREDIAATFDRNANNITCDEIPDTTANSSYWSNEVLYKTRRVKNGVRYEMKNTGKVASAISPSYAVFEMTEPDGTVHVIFDNSKDYDIKLIKTCIEVVVSFAVVASILTLKTIEDRKKIKQKNSFAQVAKLILIVFIRCQNHRDNNWFALSIFIKERTKGVDDSTVDRLDIGIFILEGNADSIEKKTLALANQITRLSHIDKATAENIWAC